MTNINNIFNKRKAFIPFITAYFPTKDDTIRIVDELILNGADLIEIGIPFSDPIAEGKIIQEANIKALANQFTLEKLFLMMEEIREKHKDFPFVFMTYLNPVFHYGYDKFFRRMNDLNICGIIIPDLPYEEQEEAKSISKQYGISVISLIAPTSKQRIEKISKDSEGFIYLVSSLGVTGLRENINSDLSSSINEIKKYTNNPVAVGFGIQNAKQAKEIALNSDGIIIGSKIIDIVFNNQNYLEEIAKFTKEIRASLDTLTNNDKNN